MIRHYRRLAAGSLWLLGLALAQTVGDLRLDLKAFRVVSVQEQNRTVERLEAALDAKPGQLIEYQLTAQNTRTNPLRQVALVIPIPPTTFYQAPSALPVRLGDTLVTPEFSFDGGKSYGRPPLKRKLRVLENGKEVEKEVEVKPEEYTHVRWVIPQVEPRQTLILSLRVVVR